MVLKRQINSSYGNQITPNGTLVLLSAVAIGLPSVLVLPIADFVLTQSELTAFIKIWAVVNTCITGVTSPLFTFAPILRMSFGEKSAEFDNCFFPVGVFLSSVVVLPSVIILYYCFFAFNELRNLITVIVFAILLISFNVKNALLVSKGKYREYFFGAAVFGVASTIGLGFLRNTSTQAIQVIFYIFSFSLFISSLKVLCSSMTHFSRARLLSFVRHIRLNGSPKMFFTTVLIVSISSFISNGPLFFGSAIGASNLQIVTYATFLNISLICYTILNSFTAPVQTVLISSLIHADHNLFRLVYRKWLFRYALCSVLFTIFLTITLNLFASLYVPSILSQGLINRFIMVLGIGFSTISGLPRLGLMIFNSFNLLFKIWLLGLLVFLFVILLPIGSLNAMVLAPTVASGLILVISHTVFNIRISELGPNQSNAETH